MNGGDAQYETGTHQVSISVAQEPKEQTNQPVQKDVIPKGTPIYTGGTVSRPVNHDIYRTEPTSC